MNELERWYFVRQQAEKLHQLDNNMHVSLRWDTSAGFVVHVYVTNDLKEEAELGWKFRGSLEKISRFLEIIIDSPQT